MLTYSASQLWSVLHGMTRSVCRIEASVYTTLKTTGIIAVRPTHRGTKRPANWPIPVLTSSAPRSCVYKQTGHRGSNVNNLIQIPTNRWDFPSILCANARSVTNKIDELDAECQNKCIDVAGITETWLKNDIPSISLQLSGFYPPLRNDRNSRRGGGVACYVRQGIQYKHWEELQELCAENVWLTIMPKRLPRNISIIIIGNMWMIKFKERSSKNHVIHKVNFMVITKVIRLMFPNIVQSGQE